MEDVKGKFEEGVYKLEYCTFSYVHQQIYKYATRQKTKEEPTALRSTIGMASRNTMNLQALQYHILENMIANTNENDDKEAEEDDDELLTVYLNESGKKEFNKFVFETLTQIQSYYKLELYVNPEFDDENGPMDEQLNSAKID